MDDKTKKALRAFEREFDSVIWQRGGQYYREGLVRSVTRDKDVIRARCQGNSLYTLRINLQHKELSCSCPYEFACKHLAALIIWLRKNRPLETDALEKELGGLSKAELVRRLKILLEKNPEQQKYFQPADSEALRRAIRKLWVPQHGPDESFLNELSFIREQVDRAKEFETLELFLNKLVDMYDHDPESSQLDGEIEAVIEDALKSKRFGRIQKERIKAIARNCGFGI